MNIFSKLWKGVKAAHMAMKDKEDYSEHLKDLYEKFKTGKQRQWMFIGDSYYRVENEILKRKMERVVDGKKIDESYKSNNKLAHSNYKIMVDEKVAYVFSKEYTLKCENKEYLKSVQEVLGKKFKHTLMRTGYKASNAGISWWHPYIDEKGEFKILIAPSERCIPEWTDNNHDELAALHYVYEEEYYKGSEKKTRVHYETWTADGVVCRIQEDTSLFLDYNSNNDESGNPVSHFKNNDGWTSWGRVPWIPIKNNDIELPDIKFVKTLIDNYDKSRSEAANYVEDTKNLIYVLKGYKGDSLDVFLHDLNVKRAIAVDADDDETNSGVSTLTPTMDITALKEHYEQLKRDIVESGQGVNKDLDKFGSAPSGVALNFLYSGLNLKADALVTHATFAFEELIYFINKYLNIEKAPAEIEITFNLDMKINETEKINNLNSSRTNLSLDTYLFNHPYVKNLEEEKKLITKEQEEHPFKDKVPIGGDDGTE